MSHQREGKVDRVACPWLVKKFVDPAAEFVFLPHETDWAAITDGIVYDLPGCELGHHGEDVSFTQSKRSTALVIRRWSFWRESFVLRTLVPLIRTPPEKAFAGSPTDSVHSAWPMPKS
jgi:chromate resistance exported protein